MVARVVARDVENGILYSMVPIYCRSPPIFANKLAASLSACTSFSMAGAAKSPSACAGGSMTGAAAADVLLNLSKGFTEMLSMDVFELGTMSSLSTCYRGGGGGGGYGMNRG